MYANLVASSMLSTRERPQSLQATLFWPAVEMQDGGVWGHGRGYVNVVSYHVGTKGKLAPIQYFVTKVQIIR